MAFLPIPAMAAGHRGISLPDLTHPSLPLCLTGPYSQARSTQIAVNLQFQHQIAASLQLEHEIVIKSKRKIKGNDHPRHSRQCFERFLQRTLSALRPLALCLHCQQLRPFLLL